MKLFRGFVFVCVAAGLTATAWGQMGLYGSPDTLRLTPMQQPQYAAQSAYQAIPEATPGPVLGEPVRPFVQTAADVPIAPRPPRNIGPAQPALTPPTGPQSGLPPPGPTSPPSVVTEMLGDPGGQGACAVGAGPAACNGCDAAPGCDLPDLCAASCNPWYVNVSALALTRGNMPNKLWTTFEWGNQANQLMNTQDISFDWRWGGEIRFGRSFCCNQWAVEATYWTLDPFEGMASCTNPNHVGTPITTGHVDYDGEGANALFDNAQEHRLWRTNEFHNVEINVIRNQLIGGCGCPASVDFSFGPRFFRFRERLVFGSVEHDCEWGEDGGEHEAYMNDEITNNLIGFQVGFNGQWNVTPCLQLFLTPRFGIYGNHIRNEFQTYRGDGTVGTQSEYPDRSFPVHSSRTVVSFLTQIDVGLNWQITPCWDARIGYRLIAVTGVGLADNQIPPFLVDIPAIADIEHNGDLILHGAFVGVTYRF